MPVPGRRPGRRAVAVVGAVAVTGAVAMTTGCGAAYQSGRTPVAADESGQWGDHDPGTWFDPAVAESLSTELDTALDGTDWCAGWVVNVEDVVFRASDVGSNRGPGTIAHTCDRWVEITVEVVYTSESSEADDTAGLRVDASEPRLEADLRAHPSLLDGTGHEALLGDAGDDAVANAVAGLPAAMAELDLVAPVAAAPSAAGEPGAFALPDAEGEGGSDTWAQHPTELIVGGVFLALAVAALLAMLVAHRLGRSGALDLPSLAGATRRRPDQPSAPAPGAPTQPGGVNPRRALRRAQLSAEATSRS